MSSRTSTSSEGDWSTPGLSEKWTPTEAPVIARRNEKEKLGRGRIFLGRRKYFLVLAVICLFFLLKPRSNSRFVIILASNQGGGVMEWKGAKEWAIERDSIKNKKEYARKWGYDLEIVDMMTKKRYAHEWRESWEKVDVIRKAFKKYPKAEWFWWLDLHTLIMEPNYSLENHIFNDLRKNTYRDINIYNPLNISHPVNDFFLEVHERNKESDGKAESINLIVPQDCGGFNLGSFFVKRSEWADRLLDLWWDPVFYEQRHMQWEHKEQDALEYLYSSQPWIRSHLAFINGRKINSFPPGACAETPGNPNIHYQVKDRDFVINMAGCQWGRDCWGEMLQYRSMSRDMNRGWFSKLLGSKKQEKPLSQPEQLARAAREHGIRP